MNLRPPGYECDFTQNGVRNRLKWVDFDALLSLFGMKKCSGAQMHDGRCVEKQAIAGFVLEKVLEEKNGEVPIFSSGGFHEMGLSPG